MSARSKTHNDNTKAVACLRKELDNMKAQALAVEPADSVSLGVASHEFDALTPTEQSAASLGVAPNSWKPIGFLNSAHYKQLIAANMLDDDLARRIEVRRAIRRAPRLPLTMPLRSRVCRRSARLRRRERSGVVGPWRSGEWTPGLAE